MWFWLCILALCSLVDYCTWALRLLIPADKLRFIKRHLDIYNYYMPTSQQQQQQQQQKDNKNNRLINDQFEYIDIENEKKLMKEFTFKYLKDDGIFAMRIMASSASDLIVTEIISELWKNYKNTMILNESTTDCGIEAVNTTSSSSTSTSQGSSPASTPAPPTFSNPYPTFNNNNNNNKKLSFQQSQQQESDTSNYSPGNLTKKLPFNYPNSSSNVIKVQYSPSSPVNQNIMPPPIPTTIPPPNSNLSNDDYNVKKPFISKEQPLLQQTNHSNVNPNSKDTHV
jgi:hypothetical protein